MKPTPKEIAKNYSKPLFDDAKRAGSLVECSNALKKIADFIQLPEVNRVIMDWRFDRSDEVSEIMNEFCFGTDMPPEVKRFVSQLLIDHSLHLIPLVSSYYDERVRDDAGNKLVVIKSAFPMSEAEAESITDTLKKKFNFIADRIIVEVDNSLIGGAIISFGDKVIDGSIKGRLATLEKAMKS